jgi:hypothetical protein
MGAVDRAVPAARAAFSVQLRNVIGKLGGEPAQPRVLRLEPCQPGAAVGWFRVANRHEAPRQGFGRGGSYAGLRYVNVKYFTQAPPSVSGTCAPRARLGPCP